MVFMFIKMFGLPIGKKHSSAPGKKETYDPYAVAVTTTGMAGSSVVGHVPRAISALCSIFILRGGRITNNWRLTVFP